MKSEIRLGFVPLIRTTFDVEFAHEMVSQALAALAAAGLRLVVPAESVTTLEEAQSAAKQLSEMPLDLLVVFQATFADSSMVMALAERVDALLLLWAVPEAHIGGRLRLNSMCGINLAGHALTRAGYHYEYVYGAPDSPDAIEKVGVMARAGYARRRLQHARLGRAGENPAGFETCLFDAEVIRQRFGVEVVQIDLQQQVFEAARATDPAAVQAVRSQLAERVHHLDSVDAAAANGTLSTYVALNQIADEQRLHGFSVRCWPEFFTEMGCAACGALSMLSDEMMPCSCEADVNGTITQMMLQWLSGEAAFGTDLVSIEHGADAMVIWHCGLAPLSMADAESQPGVTIHSNRKLPLLMEFTLKPGRVTVARLSEATGSYRLVIGGGEIIRAPPSFSGTSGLLRFDSPVQAVFDTIMTEGLEHHISITYGDHVAELQALARMLDLPTLNL